MAPTALPSFDQTPDKPRPFGYKAMWFAVRASDPAAVVDALEFGEAVPANWASGLKAVYAEGVPRTDDAWVFVSPPVDGWILAVSAWWPYPVAGESEVKSQHDIGKRFDALFARLMRRFDEVQFFGSHRGVGFVTWARALKGKPIRIFGFGDGETLANVGEQATEEAQLGFPNVSGLSPPDATNKIFELAEAQDAERHRLEKSGLPRREARAKVRENGRDALLDETDVLDLAAVWSIDPIRLDEQDHPAGLGLAVRLPKDSMQ